MYVYAPVSRHVHYLSLSVQRGARARGLTHVDLAVLESLLQVLVYCLVGDLADKREI